jgi:multidrug resistance protein, MATE family
MKSGTEERNQLTKKLFEGNGVEAPLMETKEVDRDQDEGEETLSVGRKILEENKKLWIVAGPSIFARFSTFGVTVISQAFIGHIGSTELAAYAIVSTVLMRFANGILVRAFLPLSLRVRIQLI